MAATTVQNTLPNEQQLTRFYAGTEAFLGTLVPPTFKLYGELQLNLARALADRNEYAGTRFKDYTPVRGPSIVDGTYVQPLSYEDLPMLARYALVGGSAAVDDTNTVHGYTYTQKPTPGKFDIDFLSGEYGFTGLPFQCTGFHFPEFTISGDIDDAEACWKWNSRVLALTKTLKAAVTDAATSGSTTTIVKTAAGWTVDQFAGAYVMMTGGPTTANLNQKREILSNTATTLTVIGAFPAAVVATDTFQIGGLFTAGIADRTRETIDFPGTQLFMDQASTIGTSQVLGRFISFSVTWANNSVGKRFAENTTGYSRYGFGAHVVTGQIRMEFDSRAEYDWWLANTAQKIRIKKTGTVIDSGAVTAKNAQIDIYNAQFDSFPMDTRDNNVTTTITFRGYVDATAGVPAAIITKNKLATLP